MIAMSDALSMCCWLANFLKRQGYKDMILPRCWEDNSAAINLWKKGYSTSKNTKHIDGRYFFAHDLQDRKLVEIRHISSRDQLADMHTKGVANQEQFDHNKNSVFNSASQMGDADNPIIHPTLEPYVQPEGEGPWGMPSSD